MDRYPSDAAGRGRAAEAVAFGRWILKHADTCTSKDGMFCWKYGDEEYDTAELYKEFIKENAFVSQLVEDIVSKTIK